jgi:tyrosinase
MAAANKLRIRRSIQELQADYAKGDKKPLEDLMRAWKGIKELPPDDARSFFTLGGYHGEPFRGAGWGSSAYWGGYCNHGNILFPTWHRIYILKLEEALQSIDGCHDVMLPYWDETSEDSLENGIPPALTDRDFVLDGKTVPNPLRSFVFNQNIRDNISGDDPDYSKPKGYETVRYPLSGLVGNAAERAKTAEHNAKYPNYDDNVKLLNRNIVEWLTSHIVVNGTVTSTNVAAKYAACLSAPNYTVFSNTTSAAQWNTNRSSGSASVVPLESPHNSIHLAVGGFDAPSQHSSPIEGANGDMGENDTAGLDPIFFFHHCYVDLVFWLWQQRNGFTQHLEIIQEYPGTNSVDGQGPTPGSTPNSWLTLESPLNPFKYREGNDERPYTSLDCIDIENQLGYTYSPSSLQQSRKETLLPEGRSTKKICISGINRAPIRGSFLISAYATVGGKKYYVGTEAVLSRWNVQGCANCQTHLETKAFIDLHAFDPGLIETAVYDVEIRTRDGLLGRTRPLATFEKKPFRLEVR